MIIFVHVYFVNNIIASNNSLIFRVYWNFKDTEKERCFTFEEREHHPHPEVAPTQELSEGDLEENQRYPHHTEADQERYQEGSLRKKDTGENLGMRWLSWEAKG